MPTPDDEAMVSPVEHESIAGRTTCPPEDARIIPTHELNDTPSPSVPMQQPTPSPQSSREPTQAPDDIHSKISSTNIEAPSRDIPTPMTATDDGTEEQRTSQASPLSTAAPVSLLANHLSSPFPAHRVRCFQHADRALRNANIADGDTVYTKHIVLPPSTR
jgi:hypothetical protein